MFRLLYDLVPYDPPEFSGGGLNPWVIIIGGLVVLALVVFLIIKLAKKK